MPRDLEEIAIGILTARWITSPIIKITAGSEEIAKGNLDQQVDEDSPVIELKTLGYSFKQACSEWQEPEIRMERVKQDLGNTDIQFTLNYYVDDIRLEDDERRIRVNSDIHREIMTYLQDACISASKNH